MAYAKLPNGKLVKFPDEWTPEQLDTQVRADFPDVFHAYDAEAPALDKITQGVGKQLGGVTPREADPAGVIDQILAGAARQFGGVSLRGSSNEPASPDTDGSLLDSILGPLDSLIGRPAAPTIPSTTLQPLPPPPMPAPGKPIIAPDGRVIIPPPGEARAEALGGNHPILEALGLGQTAFLDRPEQLNPSGLLPRAGKDLLAGAGMMAGGGLGLIDMLSPHPAGADQQPLGRDVLAASAKLLPEEPALGDEVVAGIGSSLAAMGPGVGVALLSKSLPLLAGATTSGLLEAFPASGAVYTDLVRRGMDPEQAKREVLPKLVADFMTAAVSDKLTAFKDTASPLYRILSQSPAEAVEEYEQAFTESRAKGERFDNDAALHQALVGAIAGPIGGAPAAMLSDTPTSKDRERDTRFALESPAAADRTARDLLNPNSRAYDNTLVEPKPAAPKAEAPMAPIATPEAPPEEPRTAVPEVQDIRTPEQLPTVPQGGVVDGRTVRDVVPNMASIEASIPNPRVLPGVREIPISAFDPEYVGGISREGLDARTQRLADNIAASGEIAPLIVAYDAEGPYILEGAHRFDALIASGAKSLPAVVVLDQDALAVQQTALPETQDTRTPAAENREFSSSQVALDAAEASEVRSVANTLIDAADIDPVDGLETRPHITVKYGLHTAEAADLAPILSGEGPATAKVEGIEIFENDTKDVVVLRVSSPDLDRLNKTIGKNLEVTDTYPDYKPHITLGYVKKGTGQKYRGAKTGLEGRELTFSAVEFSGKDRSITPIALNATRTGAAPETGVRDMQTPDGEPYRGGPQREPRWAMPQVFKSDELTMLPAAKSFNPIAHQVVAPPDATALKFAEKYAQLDVTAGGQLQRAVLARALNDLTAAGFPTDVLMPDVRALVISRAGPGQASHIGVNPLFLEGDGSIIAVRDYLIADAIGDKGSPLLRHSIAEHLAHEFMHSVDKGHQTLNTWGRRWNSEASPLFALDGTGEVMNDLMRAFLENRLGLGAMLSYPFAGGKLKAALAEPGNAALESHLRSEAFAQLGAIFYTDGATPASRAKLKEAMPNAIAFMEELHDAITRVDDGAGTLEQRVSAAFRRDAAPQLRDAPVPARRAGTEVQNSAGDGQPGPRAGGDQDAGVPGGDAVLAQQTETEAFKRWFGSSKVVDADGKPLRVYHGTRADFTAFSREFAGEGMSGEARDGFFFTPDPEEASGYASGSEPGGRVIPVYLAIHNPVEINYADHEIDNIIDADAQLAGYLRRAQGFSARLRGKDGLILRDIGGERGRDLYVAFRPEQIKSAIGNRGTFDPNAVDIRDVRTPPPGIQTPYLNPWGTGQPNIEGDLENTLKGLRILYNSASDVLRRQPGLVHIADAVDQRFDQANALLGEMSYIMRQAEEPFRKLSKAERLDAHYTFSDYFAHRENGRTQAAQETYDSAAPEVRALIDAWNEVADKTGDKLLAIGQKVYDADTGKWRKLRKVDLFFPRVFKPEVLEALNNPAKYPELLETIEDALIREGFVEDSADGRLEARKLVRERYQETTSADYFAGTEKARRKQLPEILYDYSWDAANNYIARWADRTAQIEAFGQKGPEQDLFQQMMGKVDKRTQEYLTLVSNGVYSVRPSDKWSSRVQDLNNITTALLLGTGVGTLNNLIGGALVNSATHGLGPTLRAMGPLLTDFRNAVDEAKQKGVLLHDMLQMEHDRIRYGGSVGVTNATTAVLRYSGFLPAETLVRTQAMLMGRVMLRDMLAAWNANIESRQSLKHLAVIQRHGFDYKALLAENGNGPETNRYLRWVSNVGQGSYTPANHPAFLETLPMRVLAKFQKWGTNMSRNFMDNFATPFAKSIYQGGETVTYEVGGVEHQARVRSFWPMLRFLGVMAGGSYFFLSPVMQALFGSGDDLPDEDEINKALADGETAEALLLAAGATWDSLLHVSAFGILQVPVEITAQLAGNERVNYPFAPVMNILERFQNLILRATEEGKLTAAALLEWAEGTAPVMRNLKRAAGPAMAALDMDAGHLEMWRRNMSDLNRRKRRFAEELELEGGRPPDRVPRGPFSDVNLQIGEALILGRPEQARALYEDHVLTLANRDELEAFDASVRASVRARMPFNVHQSPSKGTLVKFKGWLAKTAGPDEAARFLAMQIAYVDAAQKAGLLSRTNPYEERMAVLEWERGRQPRTPEELARIRKIKEIMRKAKGK